MVERILVLAPHTDDAEFGCGGSIARFVSEGKDVFQVAFSAAEASLPGDCPRDLLRQEIREAVHALGMHESRLTVLNYPVREFPLHRQEILEDMIRLQRDIRPDRLL